MLIRAHHPLAGQRLDVRQEGNGTLVLAHPDGGGLRVPRNWTDADGAVTPDQLAKASVQSATTGLREVIELVESLKHRSPTRKE